jgi:hypothetical protein
VGVAELTFIDEWPPATHGRRCGLGYPHPPYTSRSWISGASENRRQFHLPLGARPAPDRNGVALA